MARVATARRPLTVEYDFHGEPLRSDAASGEGAGMDLPGICGERFRFYAARPSN